jgi:primosomal protein N'
MRSNIQRICPKCGKFLVLASPPYFKKRSYKCEDCAYSVSFMRTFGCPKCEHGRLKLMAEGTGTANGKVSAQEYIYGCDLCYEISVMEEPINE